MFRTSKTATPLSAVDRAASDAARSTARERFKHLADDAGVDDAPSEIDSDNPPMSDKQLARLRPAADIVPGLVSESLRRKGGRPKSEVPKVAISIRLDADVIEALRLSGLGWQTRANEMLRKSLGLAA